MSKARACLVSFAAADALWSEALAEKFGKRAGDARYLPEGKGDPGSDLRWLHDERMARMLAWEEAREEERGARA